MCYVSLQAWEIPGVVVGCFESNMEHFKIKHIAACWPSGIFYVSICGSAAETSHAYLRVFYVSLQKPHSLDHIVSTGAFLFPQEVTVAGVPC